jgi:hypothetical protein
MLRTDEEGSGMYLNIEIPDDLGAVLNARAQAHGVSGAEYASRMIEEALASEVAADGSGQPFETGYGMWAKYGTAPSIEEIDENRREMFRGIGR